MPIGFLTAQADPRYCEMIKVFETIENYLIILFETAMTCDWSQLWN